MSEAKLEAIPKLTDKNYHSWIVNIRAVLRQRKLWDATQEALTPESNTKAKESHQSSADIMTVTISPAIQQKISEAEFNDGHLMLQKLQSRLSPTTEFNFFRACQELFSLRQGKTVDEFLDQVKFLNEQIDATKLELTSEKRTFLALMMGLSEEYRSLVQIWSVTPSITIEKAIQMVREEAIRIGPNPYEHETAYSARSGGNNRSRVECWYCKRVGHKEENCWDKYPEKRPDHQYVVHPVKLQEGSKIAKIAGPPTSEEAW